MIMSCALVLLNPPCHEIATEHSLSMENNIKNNRGSPHDSLPLRMEEVMSNHTMIATEDDTDLALILSTANFHSPNPS